ncbi:DEAD/DEAH box helicase [Williamsia sterculiae]|uniref:DEAD/DEAH box helicase domain-containing protein n=1 Tax=Williamsia sterculiae TaxID=1344003 RepID=A0A1N7F3D1_9NOCA|nr:DEAD/DEAH box helicase [Williamsia sterculiae]SIR94821.1 DEAD/DEAH box helicase domain-containing protein [Williamsia sterculiae]
MTAEPVVPEPAQPAVGFGAELLERTLAGVSTEDWSPVTHQTVIPSRTARYDDWPRWIAPAVRAAFADAGITRPWAHQVRAADAARSGDHVIVASGTASGKSLVYQSAVLTELLADPTATALYLSPTKALGADQIRALGRLLAGRSDFNHLQPCAYDGDTDIEIRQWARMHSRWIFTNPDMLHVGILGNHQRWRHFFRHLKYIVIDECHHYRGVFGSNTAMVLRRLLRVARAAGGNPIVIGASATAGAPGAALSRLIGEPCTEVVEDTSPHGERTVALWEPGFVPEVTGGNGAPVRRSAGADAARIMADLVVEGARTLCFVRSRRGVEVTARTTRQLLADVDPDLVDRIAAYRAGYLADDRRKLESDIADGRLLGVATTNALELGVDISGLDAIVVAGYPGTVASFWQQAGRAGRRGAGSLVVLVARDDPLDTYLVHHPDALLDKPVEMTVTDPANPYVLGPHLLCAAAELPLTESDVEAWDAAELVDELTAIGHLRRRPAGWYVAAGLEPHADIDIRGGIGGQVMIVDVTESRLLGTVDSGRAPSTVHAGAVHIHQGASYVVDELDLDEGLALVHPDEPDWTTMARESTSVDITEVVHSNQFGAVSVQLVAVDVTHQVTGYLRKSLTGEVLDSVELDMPPQTLHTRAVMYTITPEALEEVGLTVGRFPGALHAAEHAAIGLLPLVATCDRWDIGGLSTNVHPDTGLPTVFVYDGYAGGAGFAERGHTAFVTWITATRDAVLSCTCERGCPSCVQSPKCGNGNEPLDKDGALRVLTLLLREMT